jgi:hypothetical protein
MIRESFGGLEALNVPRLSNLKCRIDPNKEFSYSIDDRRHTNAVTSFEADNRFPTDDIL